MLSKVAPALKSRTPFMPLVYVPSVTLSLTVLMLSKKRTSALSMAWVLLLCFRKGWLSPLLRVGHLKQK
ncbi:hypothetical protein VN97_g2718 [Penicillium thymicola]|uniref:Uncharacterized protein n=1 Tax=Penicillium thymicola TaxID=293382 RepID=A0AAI9TPC1_PENTH|nr:hypothetical protein VN97_g2718 [Penicillium thymicola]